jgi:diguanylate cyclase (GGDEF)-like protein
MKHPHVSPNPGRNKRPRFMRDVTQTKLNFLEQIYNDQHKVIPAPPEDSQKNISKANVLAVKTTNQEGNKDLFIVDADPKFSHDLRDQLNYYGYSCRVFETLQAFRDGVDASDPVAVLMSMDMPDGSGPDEIDSMRSGEKELFPTIFISSNGDMPHRLRAVRAGGRAYYQKPFDSGELLETLDSMISFHDEEQFKVLVVDDDESLAEHFSLVLQDAGMNVRVEVDPMQVMESLENLQPDLLLMDLYMPGCNGWELACVIRQQPAFLTLPIVFLSGESNVDRQLSAMSFGGDDFLTKPIEPSHLVSSVRLRIKRARKLRYNMINDGLTGLLNHSTTKERLVLEVERAKRKNGMFSFAMIDLDKFKLVNDTYGHPTGDRVIKSLANLLKQRMRNTDIVGRFGGEEFAVILFDTGGAEAFKILEDIRLAFAKIEHQHEETIFFETFSCGVASFTQFSDAEAINSAADKALYAAKDGGRNRVIMA